MVLFSVDFVLVKNIYIFPDANRLHSRGQTAKNGFQAGEGFLFGNESRGCID